MREWNGVLGREMKGGEVVMDGLGESWAGGDVSGVVSVGCVRALW